MASNRSFSVLNTPEIIWVLDPDKVAEFWTTVLEQERKTLANAALNLMDFFDPDTCPEEYLDYLAATIAFRLESGDPVTLKRAQLRSAVRWYKEKGKINSFELLFRALGYDVEIFPLWMDKNGNTERFQVDSTWVPHARIDVQIFEKETTTIIRDSIDTLLKRMEEVRPVHVLLRGIFLGKTLEDHYNFITLDEETGEETDSLGLALEFADEDIFPMATGTTCLTHFYNERMDVRHDGIAIPARGQWHPRRDNPYVDPFTRQPYKRDKINNDTGGLIYRNEGAILRRDNVPLELESGEIEVVNRDGNQRDKNGATFKHDLLAYNGKYFHNCRQGWETDILQILFAINKQDVVRWIYRHDGIVTQRDGTLPHRGSDSFAIDNLDLSIQINETPDSVPEISDSFHTILRRDGVDRVGCQLRHDGEITNRRWTGYQRNNGYTVLHDGTYEHDGTLPDRFAHPAVAHDGTISHRGAYGAVRRNNGNPFTPCWDVPEEGDNPGDVFGGTAMMIALEDYMYPARWDVGEWDTGNWDGVVPNPGSPAEYSEVAIYDSAQELADIIVIGT